MKLLAFMTIILIISLLSPVYSIEISGRILIDTGHSSHDIQSILSSAITVLEINNYLVKMSNSVGILDDFDVLILSVPTQPYSVQELNSIHRFIENGGGLFLMGESGCIFHDPMINKDKFLFHSCLKKRLKEENYNFMGFVFQIAIFLL